MNDRQIKGIGASLAMVGLALTLFASLAGAHSSADERLPVRTMDNFYHLIDSATTMAWR